MRGGELENFAWTHCLLFGTNTDASYINQDGRGEQGSGVVRRKLRTRVTIQLAEGVVALLQQKKLLRAPVTASVACRSS